MRGKRIPWKVLVFFILGGCSESAFQVIDDGGPSGVVLQHAVLRVVAGDDQEAEVATVLPRALTVEVVDKMGNPLEGAPVRWSFSAGKGLSKGQWKESPLTTRTDANGRASMDWELGTESGQQSAWAEIVLSPGVAASPASDPALAPQSGNGKRVGFGARGKSAEPAEIVVSHDALELEEGESVAITAFVVDRYGNVVEGAEVTFTSSDETVATVDASSSSGLSTPAFVSADPVESTGAPASPEVPFLERVLTFIQ